MPLLIQAGCPSLARSGTVAPKSTRTYGEPEALASLLPSSPSLSTVSASPTPGSAIRDRIRLDDLGPVGSAARGILNPHGFTEVSVEFHCTTGREPAPEAVAHFVETLGAVTGKRVSHTFAEAMEPKGEPYSISEIQDLSTRRGQSSIQPIVSLVVMCLDEGIEDARGALGASLGATVIAIFPDRIRSLTSDPSGIEAATLVHELGHLLGLIDIEIESPRKREHPHHPGHSTNRSSVMYWAIDRADVAFELGTLPPRGFDEDDLADLSDMALGRL